MICDRESFLHSHLEASHFILQEPKYLKGISHIGPIYEFEEHPKFVSSYVIWNSYPLLDRINEVKIFKSMLTKMIEYNVIDKKERGPRPEYNTLIIK